MPASPQAWNVVTFTAISGDRAAFIWRSDSVCRGVPVSTSAKRSLDGLPQLKPTKPLLERLERMLNPNNRQLLQNSFP